MFILLLLKNFNDILFIYGGELGEKKNKKEEKQKIVKQIHYCILQ